MKLFIAALALVTMTATSAFATTNLVYPVTGDAFHAQLAQNELNLYWDYGYLYNTATYDVRAEAPLGHGTGAQMSFTISGYNTSGHSLTCNIFVRDNVLKTATNGTPATWSSAGFFQMPMTSPWVGSGDFTYNVLCDLPPNDGTLIFGVTPTGTSSFFTPITGAALHAQTAQQEESNIIYADSAVYTLTGPQWVEGSLGYGQGGNQGFYFNGVNYTGASMTCYVEVIDYTNFASYQYSNTTSGGGNFHLLVNTTAPAGNYIYTAGCLLPAGSGGSAALYVSGVTPGSGNTNLFLPTSGDGFRAQSPSVAIVDYLSGALQTQSNNLVVGASLGHYTNAGPTTFTVTGFNEGGAGVSCQVTARGQVNGAGVYQYSMSTTTYGNFSFPISTNGSSDIFSVTPSK
jgi:hypothetical protein